VDNDASGEVACDMVFEVLVLDKAFDVIALEKVVGLLVFEEEEFLLWIALLKLG
jgi:hypothetical protein